MRVIIFSIFYCLIFLRPAFLVGAPAFPLKISADKRCLVDQNDVPFFINGDTPWSLMVGCDSAEILQYLNDRQSRGFTAVIVNLIEHKFSTHPPMNAYGQGPFTTPGDYATPNPLYFQYADWVIGQAAARNILVVLAPSYLGYGCGDEGWCQEMLQNGATQCRNYGRYVGNRYRNHRNILWLEACDADAGAYSGAMAVVDAVAYGIKDADTVKPKLHSAHCYRGMSAIDCYDRPWLDVNNTYSECTGTLSESLNDWNRYLSRQKPFFFMEGRYENEGSASTVCLRSQAYWSVLSGSTGHFFGNCPLWHFGYSSSWCGLSDWVAQLNSAGSRSMTHVKSLFHSRQWHTLVPDVTHSVVTAGYTDMASALTADSATLIAYMPSNRQVTVNLAKLSGTQVNAYWFIPSTGAAVSIGTYAKNGTRNFTPSVSGDWVLVVDNADKGYPAPGSADLYTVTEFLLQPRARANGGMNVSPNPFRTSISISLPGGVSGKRAARIWIYDMSGRNIFKAQAVKETVTWDAGALPAGIYLIRAEINGKIIFHKISLLK